MEKEKEKKESSAKERKGREGIPCSPESLEEYNKVWTGIEKAIDFVNKHGKDMS